MNTLPPRNELGATGHWLRFFCLLLTFLAVAVSAPATSVLPPTFTELVNESDYVVRALVKSVKCEFRANSSGQGRKIITKVELDVREVVTGTPPPEVVLELLGGRIGDEEMIIEGAPQFKVGDESILFISGNGRTVSPLNRMQHGRYHIEEEAKTGRRFVARANRVPLQAVAEVSLPMTDGSAAELQRRMKDPTEALTPERFIQAIKSAVNPDYRHEKSK